MSDTQSQVLTESAKDILKRRLATDLDNIKSRIQTLEATLDAVFQADITQRISSSMTSSMRSLLITFGSVERSFDQALGIAPAPQTQQTQQTQQSESQTNKTFEKFFQEAWPPSARG